MFFLKTPMFHVEQLNMRIVSVLISIFLLVSCDKPDPNPELRDPIFNDLNSRLAASVQALAAEKKNYDEQKEAVEAAIPQTGQLKRAQRRLYESENQLTRLEQEKKYLELKIESQRNSAKTAYMESYRKKQPWPNPEDWEAYSLEKKFRSAKKQWSVKDRIKELSQPAKPVGPPAGGGH